MSTYKPFIFLIFVAVCVFAIYKMAYGPENDAKQYYQEYFSTNTTIKISPIDHYESDYSVLFTHYKTGFSLIGYKALSGSIYTFNFQDSISRKFFSIRLFDINDQITHSLDDQLLNKLVIVYVNKGDLSNPLYGTKQNPIPVFSFKGVKEPIRITSNDPGSVNGYETLEPTQAEYEHNVLTYLRYVMPQKEFNARFEGKK